ncbi:MAG: hypothetical protein H6831_04225 [Planctomycetes bacterium]|nr:hypothetical protein [Planctomycetota bacterium]MCB9903594.1 hypothetical protein [Planctomycetota bacterium]
MRRSGLWQRLVVFAGLCLFALVVAASIAGYTPKDDGGALSSEDEGRRAAWQLLQDAGHRVLSWQQAPGSLAQVDALLLVGEDVVESEAATGERSERDPRSGAHYLHFMESGGRAIVDVRAADWLRDEVGLDVDEDRFDAPTPFASLESRAGEPFDANLESCLGLPRTVDGDPGTVVLAGAEGEPFATLYPVGDGALLLVGDTDLWRNSAIGQRDHAYLLLALVGMVGGDRTVLFDEFARGVHSPPGFLSITFRGRVAPLGWTLLLWITLSVTASIWAWRFPRDPRTRDEVHPFLRVQSGARLLDRARRPVDVAERLRAGVLKRLARRLHREEVDGRSERLLALSVDRAPDAGSSARWNEVLSGKLPTRRKELNDWAAELLEIERAVEASLRRETHAGAGRNPR